MNYVLTFLSILISASAFASNYPSDYCDTRTSLYEDNAIVVVKATSGCATTRIVVGYKSNGFIQTEENITAVVMPLCGTAYQAPQTITVGKEWHGKGHVSFPIDESCGYDSNLNGVKIAFTDGKGHWDSRFGQNYVFNFNTNPNKYFQTGDITYGDLPPSVWGFILGEMY